MKISEKYEYSMSDKLYRLCNSKRYFTSGTNTQYDKMFSAARDPEMTCRDLAVIIYTCTTGADVSKIQEEIEKIYNEILEWEDDDRQEEEARKRDELYLIGIEYNNY